jgi:hypothetical protein
MLCHKLWFRALRRRRDYFCPVRPARILGQIRLSSFPVVISCAPPCPHLHPSWCLAYRQNTVQPDELRCPGKATHKSAHERSLPRGCTIARKGPAATAPHTPSLHPALPNTMPTKPPNQARAVALFSLLAGVCLTRPSAARVADPPVSSNAGQPERPSGPTPLPDHPGNIFLQGEIVRVPRPPTVPHEATPWRLLDDRHQPTRTAALPAPTSARNEPIDLGPLAVGWYRLEFGTSTQPALAWTTLAVLSRLRAPLPADSPIAVDSATAWFARDDAAQQARLASLAALAGVSWVRDRLPMNPPAHRATTSHENSGSYYTTICSYFRGNLPAGTGSDAFHYVPDCGAELGDAGERVPLGFSGPRRELVRRMLSPLRAEGQATARCRASRGLLNLIPAVGT